MQYSIETALMGYTVIVPLVYHQVLLIFLLLLQLLGRNVFPVSMLSYIPEPPLPHPRVSRIKKAAAEDSLESSESQEESDPVPKHRKPRVMKLHGCNISVINPLVPKGSPFDE